MLPSELSLGADLGRVDLGAEAAEVEHVRGDEVDPDEGVEKHQSAQPPQEVHY